MDGRPAPITVTEAAIAQIANLLLMTPHFYRASQAGRDTAAQLQSLDLSIDIVFRVLQKDG